MTPPWQSTGRPRSAATCCEVPSRKTAKRPRNAVIHCFFSSVRGSEVPRGPGLGQLSQLCSIIWALGRPVVISLLVAQARVSECTTREKRWLSSVLGTQRCCESSSYPQRLGVYSITAESPLTKIGGPALLQQLRIMKSKWQALEPQGVVGDPVKTHSFFLNFETFENNMSNTNRMSGGLSDSSAPPLPGPPRLARDGA